MSAQSTLNALHRLVSARKIHSVWRGFYAIVLHDYGLDGDAPPVEYIDQLMNHLRTNYYIALLSAASYQGASHQSPQVFQVMCDKQLRSKTVCNSKLEFVCKSKMPIRGIDEKVVKSGTIKVSVPALTALDLVGHPNRSGGISNVASVLAELSGAIDFNLIDGALLKSEPKSTVQRLGYLLENVLDEQALANRLFDKCRQAGIRFARTDLVLRQPAEKLGYDAKWQVVINYRVEVEM